MSALPLFQPFPREVPRPPQRHAGGLSIGSIQSGSGSVAATSAGITIGNLPGIEFPDVNPFAGVFDLVTIHSGQLSVGSLTNAGSTGQWQQGSYSLGIALGESIVIPPEESGWLGIRFLDAIRGRGVATALRSEDIIVAVREGRALPRSERLRALAQQALEANRRPEAVEAWAKQLADDVADLTD